MNTYYPEPANEAVLKRKRTIETGFPSPATDHLEERLNLQEYVVRHPASTFFSRVAGNEEAGLGLRDGDILVIDRSLAPKHDCLVIAEMEGEFRVCRVLNNRGSWLLETGDGYRMPVSFESGYHSTIWGRITHIVKSV
jgi:DNA polymerase V